MKLQLSQEEKQEFIEEIQNFFAAERDMDLGIIAASDILEFFIDEIGVNLFNKGVDTSKKFMEKKMEDAVYDMDELYR